ncbi:NosD domain-containing protein [Methanolobus sp. ZRKC5]|uniref:NosD domain-containing protein n=1 Tax=unclassified Methanolobus TaxID=2629569 RepID=UPI00313B26CF
MNQKKLHIFRYSIVLLILLSCMGIVSATEITDEEQQHILATHQLPIEITSAATRLIEEQELRLASHDLPAEITSAAITTTSGQEYELTTEPLGMIMPATITVGESGKNYTTISAAVLNANSGDTILVSDGTYTENVIVNKTVTIISENGSASTVVRSSGNSVFNISSDNVIISGFNITGATSTDNSGIYVSSVSGCNISDNQLNGNYYGVYTNNSSYLNVKNNNFVNGGALFEHTENSTIENVTVSESEFGVILSLSSFNTIDGINVSSGLCSIYLSSSSNNTVINNTASDNMFGIFVYSSGNNAFTNNIANNNGIGIIFDSSNNSTIINNTASDNNGYGIVLSSSNNSVLTNNTASNNVGSGIVLASSNSNTMVNNTMASNTHNFGVQGDTLEEFIHNIDSTNLVDSKPLYYWVNRSDAEIPADAGLVCVINSTNITVKDLELTKGEDGVLFAYTNHSTIQNVNASRNYYGVDLINSNYINLENITAVNNIEDGFYLYHSSNNILSNNTASSNSDSGIYLSHSSNTTMINNTMSSNSGNFGAYGSSLQQFIHNIDISNLVDNKPLYYWVNRSDAEIPADAGLVYAINSTNITAKDLELTKGVYGVLFAYTNNSTIQNVNSSGNYRGVRLINSNYAILDNITTRNNTVDGIYFTGSDNNILTNNTVSSNADDGIDLYVSSNNTFINNIVSANADNGIHLSTSSNNALINNTVISNSDIGIVIYRSGNTTLTENYAINNSDYDLIVDSCSDNIIDNLVLTNNSAELSFVSDSDVKLKGVETVATALSGKTSMNRYVTIVNSSVSTMNFTFFYDDSGLSSSLEDSVALYRLNNSEWLAVSGTSLNTTDNYVSVSLSEFGTFGLFKETISTSSTSSGSSGSSVASRVRSQGTETQLSANDGGEISADTTAKSSDTKTTLTFYKGTAATDPLGNPVSKIIVTKPASLPVDTPAEVVESGLYYDFGPSGTTFNKEVLIAIDFNPEDFEDKAPTIYTYTSEGGWEALKTTIDWESGKATAMISHFSMYALFGTDTEEVKETAVETPEVITEASDVVEEVTPADNDDNSGYLYWITGVGIVLMLGIVVIRKQKGD